MYYFQLVDPTNRHLPKPRFHGAQSHALDALSLFENSNAFAEYAINAGMLLTWREVTGLRGHGRPNLNAPVVVFLEREPSR